MKSERAKHLNPMAWIPFITVVCLITTAVCGSVVGKPVYPLYAIASGSPDPSQADLELIARSFSLIQGNFRREDIKTIHRINPDFRNVNYVNSSYTQNAVQVPLVEGTYRSALIMFPVARLAAGIDKSDTKFKLESTPEHDHEQIALKGSTRAGRTSSDGRDARSTQSFVTWVLVGDEFMRIEDFDSASNTIKVTRAFDGTKAGKHKEGALVFSPAYLGSQNLTGAWPGGPGEHLRYGFDPGKPESGLWIASRAKEIMKEGYDGVWLDIMSASAFNLCDSLGRKVDPWNFGKGRYYTPDEYRRGQELKVSVIQETVFNDTGRYPVIVANNMASKNFDIGRGGLRKLLESTDIKPRPIEGYCIEGFAGGFFAKVSEGIVGGLEFHTGTTWLENVRMLMKCAQEKLAAYPMSGKAGSKTLLIEPLVEERVAFEDFAYASYLLAVEADFETPFGIPAFYQKDGKRYACLDPRYTWPIGDPVETRAPEDLEGYQIKGHVSYRRNFGNGIVLVNPTEQMDKPLQLERAYVDPRTGKTVRSLELGPHTGIILLAN